MTRSGFFLSVFMAVVPLFSLRAEPIETYRLELEHSSKAVRDDGLSESSSAGRDDLVERIIERRADGEIVEFDVPLEAGETRSPENWQFPARVLRPESGAMTLLNAGELAARRDAWLREAGIPVEACGSWIFTWSAFRIECDPDDTLAILARYDLRFQAIEPGTAFPTELAREPIALASDGESERGGMRWSGSGELDPDRLVAEAVETAMVIAEITGEPVSEAIARVHEDAAETHGTIAVTLDTDAHGDIWRRQIRTRTERLVDGATVETTTSQETLVRTRVE